MAHNLRGQPPLAGRPPYATDLPDSFYDMDGAAQRQRRAPREKPVDPNSRTSAYNVYDHYLDEKADMKEKDEKRFSGIGAAFMDGDSDDEDDAPPPAYHVPQAKREVPAALKPSNTARSPAPTHVNPRAPPSPAPIAAPRPGYAAPIAALQLPTGTPSPQPMPQMRQAVHAMRAPPAALKLAQSNYHAPPGILPMPSPGPSPGSPASVPSTPHPLQAPLTPITPAFARPRPPKAPAPADRASKVHWAKGIMRSGSEDGLLPKRGEKGDDFWRRFSMVYKEEKNTGGKKSKWLKKTEDGSSRLSRWVWLVGLLLIACIGGAIFLGYWFTQHTSGHKAPKALGGSANETAAPSGSQVSVTTTTSLAPSNSRHVTPTNTVARREPAPAVTVPVMHRRRSAGAHRNLR